MKKILLSLIVLASAKVFAQPNIKPADLQSYTIYIVGPTIHNGKGETIENGYMSFSNGKITGVGAMGDMHPVADAVLINAAGRHVYPGLIAPLTTLGLSEIESVRATRDYVEAGMLNPHVRALIAYNAESKVIPTVRTNGILLAQIAPQGGTISGQSSVMQLDGWSWEDAVLKADVGVHLNWPSSRVVLTPWSTDAEVQKDAQKDVINQLQTLFVAAKSYASSGKPDVFNARLNAMKGLFNGTKKLYVRANYASDIIKSVSFFKKYGITPIIVGASEAFMVVDFLVENKIPVILSQPHGLPQYPEDDIDLPFKQAKILQDAGVLFSFAIDGFWQQRNLPFMAGTTVAYGLTKDQALQAITLNAAKILGVDNQVGSLDVGKDATFFIAKGDVLDITTSEVERAFIKGKDLNLDNIHKQLARKYADKYGITMRP